MERSTIKFGEAGIDDVTEVGRKNATLGDLYNTMVPMGVHIPEGFAVTVSVFKQFMQYNNLQEPLRQLVERLDRNNYSNLNETGNAARRLIMEAKFPRMQEQEITDTYAALFPLKNGDVAVRSSIYTIGFPHLFPERLYESYLNIRGPLALIYAIKCCYASLYNNRAIKFRETHGIPHDSVFLSIGIQCMVRADLGCSGIGYTSYPVPGLPDAVRITANWGLGQNTQPETWDEYIIPKPLQSTAGISKTIGSKSRMTVYKDVSAGTNSTLTVITPPELREKPVLTDGNIHGLVQLALLLEKQYARAVEFEWAKDAADNLFYITGLQLEGINSYDHSDITHRQSSKKQDIV